MDSSEGGVVAVLDNDFTTHEVGSGTCAVDANGVGSGCTVTRECTVLDKGLSCGSLDVDVSMTVRSSDELEGCIRDLNTGIVGADGELVCLDCRIVDIVVQGCGTGE